MADRKEQQGRTRDAYLSVLGFLSEDAQRALLRYLPHLEACVDEEVRAFGDQLAEDLDRRVRKESKVLGWRLGRLATDAKCALKLPGKSKSLPAAVGGEVNGMVSAVADLKAAATESASLLRHVEAVGNQVARLSEHRVPDTLGLALTALRDAHLRWSEAAAGSAEGGGSGTVEALSGIDAKFEELTGILKAASAAAADSVPHKAGNEPATDTEDESTESHEAAAASAATATVSSGDAERGVLGEGATDEVRAAMDSPSLEAGDEEATDTGGESIEADTERDKTIEACVNDLASLVWQLTHAIQAAQLERVRRLSKSATKLKKQAKCLSKWEEAAARLRRAASEARAFVRTAAEDYRTAVRNGITAAGLDLLAGGDTVKATPQGKASRSGDEGKGGGGAASASDGTKGS